MPKSKKASPRNPNPKPVKSVAKRNTLAEQEAEISEAGRTLRQARFARRSTAKKRVARPSTATKRTSKRGS